MKLDKEQLKAIDLAVEGANLFITGAGGTGKTVVLQNVILKLLQAGKSVAVTASTGLAAVSLEGRTIHSFLGTGIAGTVQELLEFETTEAGKGMLYGVSRHLKKTDVLVVDEISMLSGDFLEMANHRLQEVRGNSQPLGGMQTIFVGDFMQLPPVVKEDEQPPRYRFGFQSPVWEKLDFKVINLTKIYRQENKDFHEALNGLRFGRFPEKFARLFDERVIADEAQVFAANPTRLYPTKKQVSAVNAHMLNKRPPFRDRKAVTFQAKLTPGKMKGVELTPAGWVENFGHAFIADPELVLKVGVPVLFIANIDPDKGIVNGTRATVVAMDAGKIKLKTGSGKQVTLDAENDKYKWELKAGNGGTRATISQVPLKLAFALTVHKSQGMSLDPVHVALSSNFESGQVYVALSRARSLEGLTIDRPLDPHKDIKVDEDCLNFYKEIGEVNLD